MKTRLAPTPSGFLHVGNILSFAVTATIARQMGATIFLRIDDMDRERADLRYVQDVFDTLRFLDIPWDEGPKDIREFEKEYSQVHRLDLYRGALEELRARGLVFACSCSRTQVTRDSFQGAYAGTCRDRGLLFGAKDVTWRLRTEPVEYVEVKTWRRGEDLGQEGLRAEDAGVGRGKEKQVKVTLPASMQDFVVRKRDGFPAYQLTSVLDDLYFGIDWVVRGEDLWPSTIAQHYLARALRKKAFNDIIFYHHPLLREANGHKLSKSAGATSIQHLRQEGWRPTDIYALAGRMLGLREPAGDWKTLGEAVLQLPSPSPDYEDRETK